MALVPRGEGVGSRQVQPQVSIELETGFKLLQDVMTVNFLYFVLLNYLSVLVLELVGLVAEENCVLQYLIRGPLPQIGNPFQVRHIHRWEW